MDVILAVMSIAWVITLLALLGEATRRYRCVYVPENERMKAGPAGAGWLAGGQRYYALLWTQACHARHLLDEQGPFCVSL